MGKGVSRARISRAGSVLVLLSVLLLAGVGVVCLAQPAAAYPDNYASGAISVPIPDPGAASHDIVVGGHGNINDLNVALTIDHTFVGDLSVALTHVPTGTSVTIIDRPGVPATALGCWYDNINATLDDESASPVENQCSSVSPAIGGTRSPNNPLSAFDGQDINGTWRLTVQDHDAVFSGTLTGWTLQFDVAPPAPANCTTINIGPPGQVPPPFTPPTQATTPGGATLPLSNWLVRYGYWYGFTYGTPSKPVIIAIDRWDYPGLRVTDYRNAPPGAAYQVPGSFEAISQIRVCDVPSTTGEIIVHKTGGPTAGADFVVSGGASPIALNDILPGTASSTGDIAPGTYSVVETDDPNDGWSQAADAYCDTSLVGVPDGFSPSQFTLHIGETIDCYFTNTRDTGIIMVLKALDDPAQLWDDDGHPTFTLRLNGPDGPFGTDVVLPTPLASPPGWDWDGGWVAPTTLTGQNGYSITEPVVPPNWYLDGITCRSGSYAGPVEAQPIVLEKGEVVYCTVTNERAPTGQLTVIKGASPADDTPFSFVGTVGEVPGCPPREECASWIKTIAGFELRDPSADHHTLPDWTGEAQYVITETDHLMGWELTGISCEGNSVPETVDLAAGTVTVVVGRDEPVICTFSNSGYGYIRLQKLVSPQDAPLATFTFDPSWLAGDINMAGGVLSMPMEVPAGSHSVTELTLPTGWVLGSASCDDGSSPSAIGVSPGETVTCTFANRFEPEGGSLTVIKRTTPAGGTGFAFDAGALGTFTLDDGGLKLFEGLGAGPYAVTETPADGWEFEAVTCTDPTGAAVDFVVDGASATVNLAEGQNVTCKFVNREEETVGPEGSLTILKVTVPVGGTGFGFDAGALGTFTLDDGGSQTFTDLAAGEYVVTETPAPDWEFASVTCDALTWAADGSSVTVNLAEGEAAVCTFANGELPYTGPNPFTLPLLFAGLSAVLMGLALWVRSVMRQVEKA